MVRSKRIISWLYHASNPIREEDIHVQDRVFTLNINRETAYEWEKSQGGIYEAQAEHGDIKASMRVKDKENFILLRGSQSLGRWVGNIEYQERMEQEYARLRGENILQREGEYFIFRQEASYKNPKMAMGIILGRIYGGGVLGERRKAIGF